MVVYCDLKSSVCLNQQSLLPGLFHTVLFGHCQKQRCELCCIPLSAILLPTLKQLWKEMSQVDTVLRNLLSIESKQVGNVVLHGTPLRKSIVIVTQSAPHPRRQGSIGVAPMGVIVEAQRSQQGKVLILWHGLHRMDCNCFISCCVCALGFWLYRFHLMWISCHTERCCSCSSRCHVSWWRMENWIIHGTGPSLLEVAWPLKVWKLWTRSSSLAWSSKAWQSVRSFGEVRGSISDTVYSFFWWSHFKAGHRRSGSRSRAFTQCWISSLFGSAWAICCTRRWSVRQTTFQTNSYNKGLQLVTTNSLTLGL